MMNRTFVRKIYWAIGLVILLILNQILANIIPLPWREANFVVLFFILTLAMSNDTKVILAAFLAGCLLDVFSHYPFGTNALALTLTVALVRWLWLSVLTDRSVQIVIINGAIGLAIYRLVIIFVIFVTAFLDSTNHGVRLGDWTRLLYEEILTVPLMVLVYFFLSRFVRKLNPKYVSLNNDLYYGRRKTFV